MIYEQRCAAATTTMLSVLSQRCFSACCVAVFRAGYSRDSDAAQLVVTAMLLSLLRCRFQRERLNEVDHCGRKNRTVPRFLLQRGLSHALQPTSLHSFHIVCWFMVVRCFSACCVAVFRAGCRRDTDAAQLAVTAMLLSLLRCRLQEATVAPGWPLFAFLMHCSLLACIRFILCVGSCSFGGNVIALRPPWRGGIPLMRIREN